MPKVYRAPNLLFAFDEAERFWLGYNSEQWILFRVGRKGNMEGIRFWAHHKSIMLHDLALLGAQATDSAMRRFEALPDTFEAFRASAGLCAEDGP